MNALLTVLLSLATLSCQTATVAQDATDSYSFVGDQQDTGSSQLAVSEDGNALTLVVGDGEMSAVLNGKPVPEERLKRQGDRLSILDASGEVVFDVRLLDGGGLVYPYRGGESWRLSRTNSPFGKSYDVLSSMRGSRRKLIGVTTSSVEGVLAAQLGLEPGSAFVIESVSPGKPADVAGMAVNDIVVAIEGEKPATSEALREQIEQRDAGDELHLSLLRNGQPMELTLVLQEPSAGLIFGEDPAENVLWSASVGDEPWPQVYVAQQQAKAALAQQGAALKQVEGQLDEVRAELEARVADLRDAQAAGENADALADREHAVEKLKAAMERLQDVSAMMRAERLGSVQEVGIASVGSDGKRTLYVPRSRVSLTKTPGAGAVDAGVMTERLDRMEERMAHLEEMLQRLVESGDGH